jgi:putative nucleotidyltransferase with HDIG domain
VAEVIRRDPSLTARLLRMVNSVYYGLSTPVNSIEEAVFYLGIRQIRQLVMVTPVVEDFQKLAGDTPFRWRDFWQHCIGTAILTREILSAVYTPTDEVDYVAGLVHDVGKIAMASAFPEHFDRIYRKQSEEGRQGRELEREILGIDHAELGALYLQNHNLPDVLIDTARYHHEPERAGHCPQVIAAVQIANLLVRHAKIGFSGDVEPASEDQCLAATGWGILFPSQSESERAITRANWQRSLDRLPTILEGLV